MVRKFGGGNVILKGWVDDIGEFYNSLSLYIQPSATEGFGLEVLEAMSYGRPVLCSTGTGACDLVRHRYYSPDAYTFQSGYDRLLAEKIEWMRRTGDLKVLGSDNRSVAENYTWDKIQQRYIELWRSLL
jgi:glycosyltransferase involved in cell wall biosynthesis